MEHGRPAWELLLDAAHQLTRAGRSPFSLDSLIRHVRRVDPARERPSLSPIVQGMTVNAPGGPVSACGEVFRRVDRGMYELLEGEKLRVGLTRAADDESSALSPPMPKDGELPEVTAYMRDVHDIFVRRGEVAEIIAARDQVFDRYRPIFDPANLGALTADDFRGFLLFRNNRHWEGIHRQGTQIVEDMDRLRQALGILLDEDEPIAQRLDRLVRRDAPNFVPGLAKAVLTPILLIVYPDLYGVWNTIAEGAMRSLGVFPEFERGESFGRSYERVNAKLLEVAEGTGVDLWTLDSLWWAVEQKVTTEVLATPESSLEMDEGEATTRAGSHFGLERHLHEFLRDNWVQTELATEWTLYEDAGDLVGYEFPTNVGRIDLLAHHRTEPRWLVVELKRGQGDDTTVGQLTRYMGWVQQNLADAGDQVEGLIISASGGDRIKYALDVVPNASLLTYEVEFRLKNS